MLLGVSQGASAASPFVTDDSFFILSLLCCCSLVISFRCDSSLHKVFTDCSLLFFIWVVFTCVRICLVLLMDGFPSLIFIYQVFLSLFTCSV